MKSQTLPTFWDSYKLLAEKNRRSARKAYSLGKDNPFHPSLRFKCINSQEDIWSVRINRSYQLSCDRYFGNDTVTWFWIGNHDDYEQFFG